MEKDIFSGKSSLYYYISSKVFLVLQDIWNEVWNTNVHLDLRWSCRRSTLTKILGNRLGILTLVLIAMNYFFRCQKSTFNLENNKC